VYTTMVTTLTGVKRSLQDALVSAHRGIPGPAAEIVNSYSKHVISQLIGPGGGTIQSLRARTGCRITINNECINGMQSVSFRGTDTQLAAAVAMVNDLLSQPDALVAASGGPGTGTSAGGVQKMYSSDEIKNLIGPGGATIKAVRDDTGARISIANEKVAGTNFQMVTITGPDAKVEAAVARIAQVIGTGMPATQQEQQSSFRMPAQPTATTTGAPEMQHMIPTEYVPKLIGPGGTVINSLRVQTGAKIVVKNEVLGTPGAQYQILAISGSEAQMMQAMTLINQTLVSSDTPKALSATGGAASGDVTYNVSREVATQLIGHAGATIKQLRATSGAKIQIDNEKHGDPGVQYQELRLGGTETQVQTATSLINQMLSAPLGSEVIAASSKPSAGSITEFVFMVPSSQAGNIIGPKGGNIKQLREGSGARITVDNEVQVGTQEQKITIKGTELQVQTAYAMINELIATGGYAMSASAICTPMTPTSTLGQPALELGSNPMSMASFCGPPIMAGFGETIGMGALLPQPGMLPLQSTMFCSAGAADASTGCAMPLLACSTPLDATTAPPASIASNCATACAAAGPPLGA